MADIERRHDGDALQPNHLAAVANAAHLLVEVLCGDQQFSFLVFGQATW